MGEGEVRTEVFSVDGDEVVAEGKVRRVTVNTEGGKTLLEVPLTVGAGVAAGVVLLAPVLAALGALAAIATDLELVVEKEG
jgi:hypothetical protein